MRNAVVVIGSGMMGSGIGAMAALAGCPTILVDLTEDRIQKGLEDAKRAISVRVENGLNSREEAEQALQCLSVSLDRDGALKQACLVIEAIVENLELKQELFAQMDAVLPESVPICSNTSGLRITDITRKCVHPERTMTTHFWLPAHLVPLVEVVMSEFTSLELAQNVQKELKRWNKEPVLVRRDLPGQLANRIFQAIIREAISIVESGLASAEDVDKAISCGMAMRFPEWGPLRHLDAIGLELGKSVQDTVLPDICADKQAGEYLNNLIREGHLGSSTGKGFYDYMTDNMDVCKKKRDAFIIEAVKVKRKIDQTYAESSPGKESDL